MIIIYDTPNDKINFHGLPTPIPHLLPKKHMGISPMRNENKSTSSTEGGDTGFIINSTGRLL